MATISSFIDGTIGEKVVESRHVDTYVVKSESNTIDFSQVTVADTDIIELVKVPKGAVVDNLVLCIDSAANPGTSLTLDIGDDFVADGYTTTSDATNTTCYFPVQGTNSYVIGTVYSAANTIDATVNLVGAAPTQGTFHVNVQYRIDEKIANA